ncbi:uncharacterized protein LOC123879290 [Maniola jurtina]|uniref:uncharacterized protein LOC123879290 n=1 Tax=Maniola jurtina TaxID=191418 RepID=UPI001E68E23B|nr:uncharacterized protein LOC123879290 [Maniola jurtina]
MLWQYLLFLEFFKAVLCGYQPTGEEVQPGSVLLPATRRGRYLANIVRRQAVDGTRIKFNKDADRMNAEAKKKVDVLSEELLPYIIAEQERRTTLYKRVMTAIQNAEKGVTVAEIRGKPPLIIRKGLLYRCPANRAPKEPDGSGVLMCEEEVEPTQVMYDSCLSAEDKELYVADNKYFFCNRHKVEGPDLPRNGTTVIGCAPIERTSLNYTANKCALEDTDDVVVHYRYYPDRSYKFVTELDPDREVCDHWNPCQIGYIFSLPSPDQALMANELWHDYEDSSEEFVPASITNYTSSSRRLAIPEGYKFTHIEYVNLTADEKITFRKPEKQLGTKLSENHYKVKWSADGRFVTITLAFPKWGPEEIGVYLVRIQQNNVTDHWETLYYWKLSSGKAALSIRSLELIPGQSKNRTNIAYRCDRCRLLSVMVRTADNNIYNLDSSKYKIRDYIDGAGKRQQYLELEIEGMRPQDFGDYFAIIQNKDGIEERVKMLTVLSPDQDNENEIRSNRLAASVDVGSSFEQTLNYSCVECSLSDVLCRGDSALAWGKLAAIPVTKMLNFNFPSFEDHFSCVYVGVFEKHKKIYRKILAVIENNSPSVTIHQVELIPPPKEGEPFQHEVSFTCDSCSAEKVFVNGIPLETSLRRNTVGSFAFYTATPSSITVHFTEYSPTYEGVYQAQFVVEGEVITKTIFEIGNGDHPPEIATTTAPQITEQDDVPSSTKIPDTKEGLIIATTTVSK